MKKLLLLFAVLATALTASAENYILYTSSDGKVVKPQEVIENGVEVDLFGANIVSNTYENGQGKILFDGEVTKIGNAAFIQRSKLTSIEIPSTVTSIGEKAFASCSNLTAVLIPNSVTEIGNFAFTRSGLISAVLPNSISEIGEGVFSNCIELATIEIPNSVTKIGQDAFQYCPSLTTVEIPNSVTEIEEGAFSSCSSMESFYSTFATEDHRCLINEGKLISFAPAGLSSYSIPNTVSKIGRKSLSDSYNLTSIEIPNSVTEIGEFAFACCIGLKSVEIPNSVTVIDFGAFTECSSLRAITIGATNPADIVADEDIFYNYDEPNPIFNQATLRVPAGSKKLYAATLPWSNFNNIEEYIPTTLRPILANTTSAPAYDLSGRRVGDGYKGIVVRERRKMLRK